MNDKIVIKRTRKYVNGQLVSEEDKSQHLINGQLVSDGGDAQQPQVSPNTLMLNISAANHFDPDALQDNRSERMSFSQFMEALKAIGFTLVLFAAFIVLMAGVSLGFSALNQYDYFNAFLPCTGAVLMLFVVGWIFLKEKGLGVQRYSADNITGFLRRLLLVPDLLLGRVSMVEGKVEKDQRVTRMSESRSRGSPNSFNDPRQYTYIYRMGNKEFTTTEEGYNCFPDAPQSCHIYYLPLSGVMVNMEVL